MFVQEKGSQKNVEEVPMKWLVTGERADKQILIEDAVHESLGK